MRNIKSFDLNLILIAFCIAFSIALAIFVNTYLGIGAGSTISAAIFLASRNSRKNLDEYREKAMMGLEEKLTTIKISPQEKTALLEKYGREAKLIDATL